MAGTRIVHGLSVFLKWAHIYSFWLVGMKTFSTTKLHWDGKKMLKEKDSSLPMAQMSKSSQLANKLYSTSVAPDQVFFKCLLFRCIPENICSASLASFVLCFSFLLWSVTFLKEYRVISYTALFMVLQGILGNLFSEKFNSLFVIS